MFAVIVAVASLSLWGYLLAFRGGFWRSAVRDDGLVPALPATGEWPDVTVVVPARDEAPAIGACVGALLRQDYPGRLAVIVVDDHSEDGTAKVARAAAAACASTRPFTVLQAPPLTAPWTGKVAAMAHGVAHTEATASQPAYLWFTDADIIHAPDTLGWLVARARRDGRVLVSLLAKLRCVEPAERALVPAFVFFFQMLYPFAWVGRTPARTFAAAGGCMLVDARALEAVGGLGRIRAALIDDCALARLLAPAGPLWLGLTERVRSLRAYPTFGDFRRMVARTAYAQLGHSALLLAATVAAMGVTFVAPAVLALFASGTAQGVAAATWAVMALAFQPTLRFYGVSPLYGVALPWIAMLYVAATIESAWRFARGRGGAWKGRVHPAPGDAGDGGLCNRSTPG